MERGKMEVWVTSLVVMLCLGRCVDAYLPTFYMDEWCSRTLDLQVQSTESARVLLRAPSRGLQFLNCNVTFKALAGRRVSFRFKGFDIRIRPTAASGFQNCDDDHLQIFDGNAQLLTGPLQMGQLGSMLTGQLTSPLTGPMCNSGEIPAGVYTTTAQEGTVSLMKRNYVHDQMELVVTSFHLAPCRSGEFSCHNTHCIAQHLYCNDYDNCGDGSDLCLLNSAGIVGVVIAVIIVLIIIVVIVALLLYRRSRCQSGKL